MAGILYYVGDPMCSWCWGFQPVFEQLRGALPASLIFRTVLGGLAPDSDVPMDAATRRYVQGAWDEVEARTGARFNRTFWEECEPRRSTYPACRAVLAAAVQDEVPERGAIAGVYGSKMFHAIQRAYYLEARNPSDLAVLASLAREVEGLNAERFEKDLVSAETEDALEAGFRLRRELGVRTFPSLVLVRGGETTPVWRGYGTAAEVLANTRAVLG